MPSSVSEAALLLLFIGGMVWLGSSQEAPQQVICAVSENGWETAGWIPLHESERPMRAEDRFSEIKAFPGAVTCTWRGQEVPVEGSMWFWRPVPDHEVTRRNVG